MNKDSIYIRNHRELSYILINHILLEQHFQYHYINYAEHRYNLFHYVSAWQLILLYTSMLYEYCGGIHAIFHFLKRQANESTFKIYNNMKDFELTFFFCVLFLPPNQSSICSSTSSIEAPWSYNGIYALDSRTVYTGNSDFGFLTLSFFSSIQKTKKKK